LHLGAGVHVAGDDLAVDGRAQGVHLVGPIGGTAAQDAGLLPGSIQLGPGLAIVRLRALEIALRSGVDVEQILLAVGLLLGRAKVGLSLGQIGKCGRHVRRLDLRQGIAFPHALAGLGLDLDHPARHR
jgi:hypothetical protein